MKAHTVISMLSLLLGIILTPVLAQAQHPAKQPHLTIGGEVETSLVIGSTDLDKLPKVRVVTKDKMKQYHIYEGVELSMLLKQAGVTSGAALRGKHLAKYVLVEANDGYQVVFALAEVDPDFTDRKIILANKKNGSPLPSHEGPFQIVIEGEKRQSRNARQVISIQVKYAK